MEVVKGYVLALGLPLLVAAGCRGIAGLRESRLHPVRGRGMRHALASGIRRGTSAHREPERRGRQRRLLHPLERQLLVGVGVRRGRPLVPGGPGLSPGDAPVRGAGRSDRREGHPGRRVLQRYRPTSRSTASRSATPARWTGARARRSSRSCGSVSARTNASRRSPKSRSRRARSSSTSSGP